MADTVHTEEQARDGQPSLKRVMGPGLLLLFIVGDILGTGIYALTGQVAALVGGVVWLPFLVAFLAADHFRTPTVLPVVGALACAFLATPWAGRPTEQYRVAGVLLGIGVLLWGVTVLVNRRTGPAIRPLDPERFTPGGPVN